MPSTPCNSNMCGCHDDGIGSEPFGENTEKSSPGSGVISGLDGIKPGIHSDCTISIASLVRSAVNGVASLFSAPSTDVGEKNTNGFEGEK